MRFSMMAVDANCMLAVCKNFIVADIESLEKMHGMGCSDDCIKEALYMFFIHVSNLYVCGLIDGEFFRTILVGMIEGDAIEELMAAANGIRKTLFASRTGRKFNKNLDTEGFL